MFKKLLTVLIKAYRLFLSPLKPACCRFLPSCSEYTLEAVEKHGAVKGGWLGLKRICSCHPWGQSGYQPVPKD
jgi:putative membrane protein insertion efficiency factor